MIKRQKEITINFKKMFFFAKISSYFPKIEKPDTTVKQAKKLSINKSNPVDSNVSKWLGEIIGKSYDNTLINDISYQKYTSQVFSLSISEKNYSESNMGHGEGRMLSILSEIEKLPNKSLVLIEEPEISLHASAQYKFGEYLMDVSIRKGHQIMITTHSEEILESLPSQSRVYLHRHNDDIKAILGLSSALAKSLMTEGYRKALSIFVEDRCAESILISILRKLDANLLKCCAFYQKGGKEEIIKLTKQLKNTNFKVSAVLDGDAQSSPSDYIYKLPGCLPPEKEIFFNEGVKSYINNEYKVNFDDLFVKIKDKDHHDWFSEISDFLCEREDTLIDLVSKVYVNSLNENKITLLVAQLKQAL